MPSEIFAADISAYGQYLIAFLSLSWQQNDVFDEKVENN